MTDDSSLKPKPLRRARNRSVDETRLDQLGREPSRQVNRRPPALARTDKKLGHEAALDLSPGFVLEAQMTFNPFVAGVHPVGVRTTSVNGSDGVRYPVEVWYPAPDRYRNVVAVDTFKVLDELPEATQEAIRDAEPAQGRRPLIMYWHGGYGHRREMAALCVFFASHGFVVAAPDFPGDHIRDTYGDSPEVKRTPIDASALARGRQAAEVVECLIAPGADEFVARFVDGESVGSFGVSLGGFTTLAVNTVSHRIKASFPIAPAWGTRSPLPQMARFTKFLRLDQWKAPHPRLS